MTEYALTRGGLAMPHPPAAPGARRSPSGRHASAFKPEEHFRDLKGQQYLEVKWRVVWFREEHPDGFIASEMVEHDATAGLAVFRATVGYALETGRAVYATSYGSETRKDFGDYLEKAETKAVGRALAMLGYGTAQATELEEGQRVVDAPVQRQRAPQPRGATGQRDSGGAARLAMVRDPVDVAALLAQVQGALSGDSDAAAKLPKAPAEMTKAELTKTLTWLTRRARALSS